MASQYANLKNEELKELLSKRGLKKTGKKADLVDRLVRDDAGQSTKEDRGRKSPAKKGRGRSPKRSPAKRKSPAKKSPAKSPRKKFRGKYAKMKNDELKALLGEKGLKKSGNKEELIKRLRRADAGKSTKLDQAGARSPRRKTAKSPARKAKSPRRKAARSPRRKAAKKAPAVVLEMALRDADLPLTGALAVLLDVYGATEVGADVAYVVQGREEMKPAPLAVPTTAEGMEGLRVQELKRIAKERGLKVSGTKKELVRRIMNPTEADYPKVRTKKAASPVRSRSPSPVRSRSPSPLLPPVGMPAAPSTLPTVPLMGSPRSPAGSPRGMALPLPRGSPSMRSPTLPGVPSMPSVTSPLGASPRYGAMPTLPTL